MREANLLLVFTERLDAAGLTYMVTGAVAGIIYGEPRLTHDADIVVALSERDAEKMAAQFPLDTFYCPPVEVIRLEANRRHRGHFNLIHHETGFKADIYLVGADELHHWALPRRRRLEIEGRATWVAPPEYVILRKLQYYREGKSEKHLDDVRGILAVSADELDHSELERLVGELRLEAEWAAVT